MADPNCAVCHGTGHFNGVRDPCTRCSPAPVPEGLDFDSAEKVAWVPAPLEVSTTYRSWDEVKYQAHINAQVAERIAAARREVLEEVASAFLGAPGPMVFSAWLNSKLEAR